MGTFRVKDVKRRKCCFCVPARIGTLALSTLSILIAVTMALQAAYALFQDNFVNSFAFTLCLVECILWSCLVNVCVYGWLGAVKERFEWVEWYYELLWWHLWINVVFGSYAIVLFSLPTAKEYRAVVCTAIGIVDGAKGGLASSREGLSPDVTARIASQCVSLVKKHLLLIDFAFVVGILVELYLVLMVAHYLDQLADVRAASQFGVDIESPNPPHSLETNYDDADNDNDTIKGRGTYRKV